MIEKGAEISSCGKYRYLLWREWIPGKRRLVWVMLNPSTADSQFDDPTVRRCMRFTADWGYGGMHVVNLFALRATNPGELFEAEDPIGPENDSTLRSYAGWPTVAAWGAHGGFCGRDRVVLELLKDSVIECLDLTKDGHPRHPLYVPANCQPVFLQIPGKLEKN